MAQVDLDPIESHGSMELSTSKFKTLGNRRFNSDRGADDSQNSKPLNTLETKPDLKKEKKAKKKPKIPKTIDVKEDTMRAFVMN